MTLSELQAYVKAHGEFPHGTVMTWTEIGTYSFAALYVNGYWYTTATSHAQTPQRMEHREFLQWLKKGYVSDVRVAMSWERIKD